MELNKDSKRRDDIVFGDGIPKYQGGTARFKNLSRDKFELLVKENFIDLEGRQNSAPSAGEFYDIFLKEYPGVTLHGYVVSSERNDYRMSIEGLDYKGRVSRKMLKEFVERCRLADEFTIEDKHLYCWFS